MLPPCLLLHHGTQCSLDDLICAHTLNGRQLAQRILLELKDKMAKESASVDFSDLAPAVPASDAASAARSDAIAGLTVLGYSMPEINAALRKLPSIEGMSADLIIKAALRAMMQQ